MLIMSRIMFLASSIVGLIGIANHDAYLVTVAVWLGVKGLVWVVLYRDKKDGR